jgi:hypothetical protein
MVTPRALQLGDDVVDAVDENGTSKERPASLVVGNPVTNRPCWELEGARHAPHPNCRTLLEQDSKVAQINYEGVGSFRTLIAGR